MNKTCVSFVTFLSFASSFLLAQTRPNIVFILADDLGNGDISYNNQDTSKFRHTPNLDSICREGIYFQNFYTHHVCSPTRAGLLTGKHYARVGSGNEVGGTLDNSIPNIAKDLKSNFYRTAAFGKWHNSYMNYPEDGNGRIVSNLSLCDSSNNIFENFKTTVWGEGVNAYGFDEWMGYYGGGGDYFTKYSSWHSDINWWINKKYAADSADGYITHQLGKAAVSFIETNKNHPFFLYLPMEAVHEPLQITRADLQELCSFFPGAWDQVKNISSPTSGRKISEVDEIRTEAGAEFDNDIIDPGKTFFEPLVYATIVYAMDKVVGDVLNTLKANGILENTIVFFCSDNGANNDGLNTPYRGSKKTLWEGGIHVPAAIWWQGKLDANLPAYAGNGGVYSGFAQYLDFYPTIMSLAGLPVAGKNLDGIDLKTFLINNSEARQGFDNPYFGIDVKKGGLKAGAWKLHYNEIPGNNTIELYNLDNDIAESVNLASSYVNIRDSLAKIYRNWYDKNNWGFSFLPIKPENIFSTEPKPAEDILEIKARQEESISNGDNNGVFIRFANPNTTEFVNNVESGDRIEFDIYVAQDSDNDLGFYFTPGRGWNPYYTSGNGVTQDSLLLSQIKWPKGKWIKKVVGIGNNATLGIGVCYIALRSPSKGFTHFYLDNVVIRKKDGNVRAIIWDKNSDTAPLIYRYKNVNYKTLAAALAINGFPFSEIEIKTTQAGNPVFTPELEALRMLKDTVITDSLIIDLAGLYGVKNENGSESISYSVSGITGYNILTADIQSDGHTLKLMRVGGEKGKAAVTIKAEYKGVVAFQIFLVSAMALDTFFPNPQLKFEVYPNPMGDYLIIEGEQTHPISVEIRTIEGLKILGANKVLTPTRISTIDILPGIYLLLLKYESDFKMVKLIKF